MSIPALLKIGAVFRQFSAVLRRLQQCFADYHCDGEVLPNLDGGRGSFQQWKSTLFLAVIIDRDHWQFSAVQIDLNFQQV